MGTPVEGGLPENVPNDEAQVIAPDQGNDSGPNPAWGEVLGILPEQFHSVVTPHFTEWDKAANKRIESIKSQYEDYAVFKEHGIGRADLEQGIRLVNMINENPKEVWEALATNFNLGAPDPTATPPVNKPGEEDDGTYTGDASQYNDPRVDQLQQGVELMAQMMLQQQQQEAQQAANSELDNDIAQIKEKHGDFNEQHLLPYIHYGLEQGQTVAQAADAYFAMRNEMIQSAQAAKPFAPTLMGGNSGNGAGLPSNAIDVTKLSGNDTRKLVAEMLAREAGR